MKKFCACVAAGSLLLLGCESQKNPAAPDVQAREVSAAPPKTAASDPVVARANGRSINMSRITPILVEGYGLNVLLAVIQLDLVRQDAEKLKLVVTEADVLAETDSTLAKMFQDADKKDYPALLDQFLQNQRVSRPEFAIAMETNAYLRKIAESMIKDKITEETLQEQFKAIYGETVQARHIECSNLQEIAEVKRRLAGGEKFDALAKELSRNARTAPLGGELPPFSRYAANIPQVVKDTAFSLKPGEVSDAVQVQGTYQLITVVQRIPPKAIKYEDVKESLRQDTHEKMVIAGMKQMRQTLSDRSDQLVEITDPTLKHQFDARQQAASAQLRDRNDIRAQLDRERKKLVEEQGTPPSTTQPSTAPVELP